MTSWSFQTVWRMCEVWKRETYVRSQSFSSDSAVKYLHVGRRKIQISLPPGEQDQSNALPQGQQRQSNPHSMPCLPPRRHCIDRCISLKLRFNRLHSLNWILSIKMRTFEACGGVRMHPVHPPGYGPVFAVQ